MNIPEIKCPLCKNNMQLVSWRSDPLIISGGGRRTLIKNETDYTYVCDCRTKIELRFTEVER